uniref:Uncharacterized protein n=1 Tax=Anguilla anguilla TaxID=7936 RepID=A0A0E9SFE6_ANGAN
MEIKPRVAHLFFFLFFPFTGSRQMK